MHVANKRKKTYNENIIFSRKRGGYRMNRILSAVFIFIVLLNFRLATAQSDIDCGPAWEKIISGALLIDVRTKEEFEAAHLEKALNIPVDVIDKQIEKVRSDKEKEILVYCRSGRRSSAAKQTLLKMGYKRVVNIGGYQTLKNCKR